MNKLKCPITASLFALAFFLGILVGNESKAADVNKILYFKTTWCGACKLQDKELNKSDLNIETVVVDSENPRYLDIYRENGPRVIPKFVFLKNGKVVKVTLGLQTAEELDKIVADLEAK